MNTPNQVFQTQWQEKLQGTNSAEYLPGNNLRVDAAVRALAPGKRLLDIGCGAGLLGLAVRDKFAEVHGVDLAEAAVNAARARGQMAQRVDLNSEALPFPSEFFDAVTMLAVLPYIYDPGHALRECHRVLRSGGKLVVSAANMRTVGKLVSTYVLGRFPSTSKGAGLGYDGGALHYFCSWNMGNLLENTDFSVRRVNGTHFRPSFLEYLPTRLPLVSPFLREFFAGEIMLEATRL
jgi:2-polyprenyl-3-methyl-5-hydroxy-6-metoxy-1,4-benzoquinol methylase